MHHINTKKIIVSLLLVIGIVHVVYVHLTISALMENQMAVVVATQQTQMTLVTSLCRSNMTDLLINPEMCNQTLTR